MGGGGQAPKCTDIKKKNHIHVTYMHERVKRASASETYALQKHNYQKHKYRPLFSHKVWRYKHDKRQYWTKHWHWGNLNYASERGASELGIFSHFHILKLLFPSIFCWYFWYFISETHFRVSKYIFIYIQSMQLVITYGMALHINDSIPTLRKHWENLCICERTERASLEIFSHFYILKLYFFQYFVGTSDTLSVQMKCLSAYM